MLFNQKRLITFIKIPYCRLSLIRVFFIFAEILLFLVNKQPRTLDTIKSNRQLLKRIRKVNMIKLTK